jgi:hypothetical protein
VSDCCRERRFSLLIRKKPILGEEKGMIVIDPKSDESTFQRQWRQPGEHSVCTFVNRADRASTTLTSMNIG